jgi:hypothetical protein
MVLHVRPLPPTPAYRMLCTPETLTHAESCSDALHRLAVHRREQPHGAYQRVHGTSYVGL